MYFEDYDDTQLSFFHLRVRYSTPTATLLHTLVGLSSTKTIQQGNFTTIVLTKANSFLNQEIHLVEDKKNPIEIPGIGSVHHLALSVKNKAELQTVENKLANKNFFNSGIKNREFFHSLYFREPNNLLIEIATEETSLSKAAHESYEKVDFKDIPLLLPDFLEPRRTTIEQRLFH